MIPSNEKKKTFGLIRGASMTFSDDLNESFDYNQLELTQNVSYETILDTVFLNLGLTLKDLLKSKMLNEKFSIERVNVLRMEQRMNI